MWRLQTRRAPRCSSPSRAASPFMRWACEGRRARRWPGRPQGALPVPPKLRPGPAGTISLTRTFLLAHKQLRLPSDAGEADLTRTAVACICGSYCSSTQLPPFAPCRSADQRPGADRVCPRHRGARHQAGGRLPGWHLSRGAAGEGRRTQLPLPGAHLCAAGGAPSAARNQHMMGGQKVAGGRGLTDRPMPAAHAVLARGVRLCTACCALHWSSRPVPHLTRVHLGCRSAAGQLFDRPHWCRCASWGPRQTPPS